MPQKSEREDVISALASTIFSAMLDDIVLDTALQSHHEVTRSRAICHVCNTHCGLGHVPGPSNYVPQAVPPPSRPSTPAAESKTTNGSLGTGTSTPTSVKADGTIYLNCVNCSRPFASNRYALHLSSCLGIGTGTRRGAARSIHTKPNNSSEGGRSASPSEGGNVSDGDRSSKEKGKSKSKRADDAEFNLKRKRPNSPQLSPHKKQKKQKTPASPVARVKTDTEGSGLSSNTHQTSASASQSKVPSRLRESSTASFADRERSSSSASASPSPGTPVASVSTPSSATNSPSLAAGSNGMGKKWKGKAPSSGPPKRPSPPRPPPPLVRMPEPDYLVDVDGEETGSSTDTDMDSQ
jgi:hypothetical protein